MLFTTVVPKRDVGGLKGKFGAWQAKANAIVWANNTIALPKRHLKQGRDWLMSQVRPDLVLQVFFPKFENGFKADFSRVKVCDVFASRFAAGKIANSNPRKVALKIVFRLRGENLQDQTGPSKQLSSWSQRDLGSF